MNDDGNTNQELMNELAVMRQRLAELEAAETEHRRTDEALSFLAHAARTLAASLDYDTTLQTTVRLAIPILADWVVVDIVDEKGQIRWEEMAHVNPAKEDLLREYQRHHPSNQRSERAQAKEDFRKLITSEPPSQRPLSEKLVAQVFKTGKPILVSNVGDPELALLSIDAEHLRLIQKLGLRSLIILPLAAHGRTLGVASFFVTESNRLYDQTDLSLIETYASRCALAIDKARLFTAEKQARQAAEQTAERIITLQAITAGLSQARTLSEVADVIIDQGLSTLGASGGSIALLSDDGAQIEILRATGYPQEVLDRWLRFPLTDHLPIAEAVRTGAYLFLESLEEWTARYPQLVELTSITGNRSLAAIPLVVREKAIGALGLSFAESREFSGDDRSFIISLAWQCAQALDRARLYDAVRESEERFKLVVTHSPDIIFLQDRDLRYTWVFNPAHPLTPEQVVGKTDFDLLPQEEAQQLTEIKKKVLETGKGARVEIWLSPGGIRRCFQAVYEPIKDKQITGLASYSRDITERKRAEAERERLLKEIDTQRHLFQTVVYNAPLGIAVINPPTFVYELVNPALQAMAPGKPMVGRTVAEVFPEFAPQVLPILDRVSRLGQPYNVIDAPVPIRRAPKAPLEEAYFIFSYVPIQSHEGRIEAVLLLAIETTEQVRVRQRIEGLAAMARHRADELESILENMVDAVYVADAEGDLILVNEAGVRLVGLDNPEEAKRALTESLEMFRIRHIDGTPIDREDLPLFRALRGETVILDDEVILKLRTRQDVHIQINAAPILDDKGKIVGAVAVARDIID